MSSPELQLHGLVWVEKAFDLEPQWTLEPDIEAIKQTIQSVRPSNTIEVTFITQGAFNKLYDVRIDDEVLIMRISLPVDPYYKTMSEVATVDWIQRTTNLPVPSIVSYQSSRDNLIGFEWILMTKIPGKPLGDKWTSLSFSAKSRLVRKLAAYSACLFRNQLRGIGNVYGRPHLVEGSASTENSLPTGEPIDVEKSLPTQTPLSDEGGTGFSAKTVPEVGRIVSNQFFWGSRIHQNIYRGPFRSSHDWIKARLVLSEIDCRSILAKYPAGVDLDSDDESDIDDATRTLNIVEKLKPLLSLVFPPNYNDPEPSIMLHDDLSRHNILVNEDGELSGVLDWECVSALPLWKACYYPSFLERRPRHSEPGIGRYRREANGEPSDLYWEHLQLYEVTVLRGVFTNEMKRLEPSWMEVFNKSQLQRDFDTAVNHCDTAFLARDIKRWIEDITAGKENFRSLRNRIDED